MALSPLFYDIKVEDLLGIYEKNNPKNIRESIVNKKRFSYNERKKTSPIPEHRYQILDEYVTYLEDNLKMIKDSDSSLSQELFYKFRSVVKRKDEYSVSIPIHVYENIKAYEGEEIKAYTQKMLIPFVFEELYLNLIFYNNLDEVHFESMKNTVISVLEEIIELTKKESNSYRLKDLLGVK